MERKMVMHRFQAIRAALSAYGLDAIMLTEEANRLYATDFPSIGRDGLCLITKTNTYYFTDSRYTVAARRSVHDAAITITGGAVGYVELLNEAIAAESLQTIGFDDAYMTAADLAAYQAQLHSTLRPASALMAALRLTKDAAEIDRMTRAQRIAEQALTELLPDIHPGMTEKQVAAMLHYRILLNGAEKVSFDPIVVSGENGAMPHGIPSDKIIGDGDFLTMDFGAMKDGYCSDMTRTYAIGHATDEMRRVYNTVLAAQTAAIAATKAGMTGREIDGIARNIIADAGFGAYFGHGYGHGLGIEIHEAPAVSPRNDQPLPAGAVTSAEPGIYIPGKFGVRIEDVVVIQPDGCINLTQMPKELTIL